MKHKAGGKFSKDLHEIEKKLREERVYITIWY